MTQTPNHGYNVPSEGTEDWHVPLNENFEAHDTDIEIRDTDANRGDYDPKAGSKFLATDTGNVYVGDGSAWQHLATSGPTPSFDELNPSNNFLGVARSQRITGNEYFGVDATVKSGEFGGMYVNTASSSAKPFYGYATGGGVGAYHFYEGGTGKWKLFNGGAHLTVGSDGSVGVGTTSPSVTLDVRGDAPRRDGVVRGETNTGLGAGVHGVNTNGTKTAYGVKGTVETTDTAAAAVKGVVNASDGGAVALRGDAEEDDQLALLTFGDGELRGDLDVTGNKNFVQAVDTAGGRKEVVYTATESDTAQTETGGVAQLEDGRAVVNLPEHFGWVTDGEEPLHVQTTPHSVDSGGLAAVERSTDRLVIADRDGEGDYEFSYTVTGTRDGHADKRVVREPSDGSGEPAPADD